jgi:hypothetical protein
MPPATVIRSHIVGCPVEGIPNIVAVPLFKYNVPAPAYAAADHPAPPGESGVGRVNPAKCNRAFPPVALVVTPRVPAFDAFNTPIASYD